MEMVRASIVSGTYNRLRSLQRMVASVRKSVGECTYEIILVDGGSTDGTLEWCTQQSDVVLIEQGKLLGAIKAFNAGCAAARGDYVVLLNDDIEVRGDAVAKSVRYLELHPEVAQVAFENLVRDDRGKKLVHPTQQRTPYGHAYGYLYGQCSTTRRHLGDLVGWWGDEGMRTYGGDTRLSMALWELGWPTVAVDGCAIIDHVLEDDLRRERRKSLRLGSGGNSDTRLFHEKWHDRLPPRAEWIGAPPPTLRIRAAQGHLRSLRYKIVPRGEDPRTGLIDALSEYGPAKQVNQSEAICTVGLRRFQEQIIEEVKGFQPHLVMFQIQSGDAAISPQTVRELRRAALGVAITNFDGDFRTSLTEDNIAIASIVDHQLISTPALFAGYRKHGCNNLVWWLNGYEAIYGEVVRAATEHSPDVVFLANVYPQSAFPEAATRIAVVRALQKAGLHVAVYGRDWPTEINARFTGDNHALNARIYATAKLGLSVSATSRHYGYTSDRLFMASATGCPVLVQRFDGMEELGYVDTKTCIAWSSADELVEKARYYAVAADEREAIGDRGRRMTHRRHSYAARVRDLLDMLSILPGKPRSV